MASLRIDIASEFTGAKAFSKAGKASSGLEKNVKKLGVAMLAAFSVTAITSFGKAAVKAFMDDQKAAAALANTLKNLGIDFAVAANEEFISSLEKSSNVADDKLRPALAKLITQTGSLTYAQDLLAKAIEISRGSGIDLETVTSDLGNAFVGNTKGLKKYATGLTAAQLASMSFEEIMAALNTQFDGSSAAYLATYAGKMDALTVASDNASEAIGKGLLDALNILAGGGETSITSVTSSIGKLAEGLADYFRGVATYVRNIYDNPIMKKIIQAAMWFIKNTGIVAPFLKIGKVGKETDTEETTPKLTAAQLALLAEQKARAAAQAKLVRAQKAAEAAAKKRAADELKLKKAGSIFDMEQINIIAALKGQVSDEDRKRLELQLAIVTGNTTQATKLAAEIARSQGLTKDLVAYYSGLPDAKNPFSGWILSLELAAKLAGDIARGNYTVAAPTYNAAVLDTIASTYGGADGGMAGFSARADASGNVNVYIGGSVVSENDLVEAVSNGLLNRSLSGSPSAIGRLKGSFAG